jgi:hypothetical protein
VEARPVGRGATCTLCFEKRREQLKLVELRNRTVPLCHGCAARVIKLDQMPPTLEALRLTLRRERRNDDRRGDEGLDRRIFPRERRVGERRMPPRDAPRDTDPNIVLADLGVPPSPGYAADGGPPDFLDVIIELQEADVELVEQTTVKVR